MATCTYSFQTAQGPLTIKGLAEFKAYLASQGVGSIVPTVMNSNARKVRVFHGSPEGFGTGENTTVRGGESGYRPFFTTPDRSLAESYSRGGSVTELEISVTPLDVSYGSPVVPKLLEIYNSDPEIISNDAVWDPEEDGSIEGNEYLFANSPDVVDYMRSQGFDSLMFEERPGVISYATFSPSQVSIPSVMESPARAPIFYSPLAKAVQDAKMDSMPGKQWGAWLLSNAGKLGVKKDEIEWSGITDWLALQTGKVSKADVASYLDGNGVQVEEVMKGEAVPLQNPDQALAYIADERGISAAEVRELYGFIDPYDYVAVANEMRKADPESRSITKYGEYTVPGGENYKELLIMLPERRREKLYAYQVIGANPASGFATREAAQAYIDEQLLIPVKLRSEVDATAWDQPTKDSFEKAIEDIESRFERFPFEINQFETQESRKQETNYFSGHWTEQNILAHVRFDERTDAEGKRILFLNEIQSDWGQQGKKDGFSRPLSADETSRLKELERMQDAYVSENGSVKAMRDNYGMTEQDSAEYLALSTQQNGEGLPSAPFVTDTKAWVALAIKRMLRYAVDNGFEKIAFISGQQAADLYDLSKRIDSIQYNSEEPGYYNVGAYQKQDTVFEQEDVPEEELENIVGKEIAQKIIAGEGRKLRVAFADLRELSGLDLKVGGEGMRTFYDQIVPQVANEVLKKAGGGKVTTIRTPADSRSFGDRNFQVNTFREEMLAKYGPGIMNKMSADEKRKLRELEDGVRDQLGIDITPEMADKISSGLPLFSNRRKPGAGSQFALPEETNYDATVRTIQNDQVRWKRQMDLLRDKGGVVNDQNDVYQAMERMVARAMNRTEDFYAKTVTPLLKQMKEASVTLDTVGEYLYAKHAKERNAYIAEINPAFAKTAYDEVGGSGMSDKEADETIARLEAGPQAADIKRFAAAFRSWAESNLDGLVQGGMLSMDQATAMRKRFPNYVPLRGFETGEDESGMFGQGAGFSTGKRLFQRTLGRRTKADNPAAYIIHQVAEGMLAREKANVGRYLERLIADNPDDKLWTIGQPEREPVMGTTPLRYALMLNGVEVDTFNTKTQAQQYKQLMNLTGATIDETGGDPKVVERDLGYDPDKEVRFIRDGKEVRIQLKDPLLGRAYNNRGAAEMGQLLRISAGINAFLREMWTQKNPVFPLVNMLRDVPAGMLYALGEGGAGTAGKLLLNIPGAWKAMWQQANGTMPSGTWGQWVDEYRKAGGGIGFRMVSDIESTMDRINRIEKKLGRESLFEALSGGKLKEAAKRLLWRTYNNAVTDFIEKLNMAFENMTRLAIYRAAREQGKSVSEASRMAKNSTVNFNRRGELTSNVNSLYLFANAAIQDLAKNKRSVADAPFKNKVMLALGGVAALGAVMAALNPDDDDLEDENQNINAMRFRVGDKTVSIPLSYGLIGFSYYAGRSAMRMVMGEDISQQTLQLTSALLTNTMFINPIPNADKIDLPNAVIGMSPTAIEFPLQVALNRNSFGSMMMPDYNNDPDAYKTFRGTRGSVYADVAEFLNESTGGNKREPGMIDISPETIKGIIHFTLGGTGKFVGDTASTVVDALDGGGFNANKVPVANRFVKQIDATVYRARFYRQAGEAKAKLELYNKYKSDRNLEKMKELSAWVPVGRTGTQIWKQMNALRDQELQAKDKLTGQALDARLRELDEKQTRLSDRFFKMYTKVSAPKSAPRS